MAERIRLQMGMKALDALSAVGAEAVKAYMAENFHHLFGGIAHHGAVFGFACIEDQTGQHGKPGLFGRSGGYPGFGQIHHGLHHDGVRTCHCDGLGLFFECLPEVVLADILGKEQLAAGPHGCKDIRLCACSLLGDLDSFDVDLGHLVRKAELAQHETVGAEGIGQDDPAAGIDIFLSHLLDLIRVGEIP